eukprot:1636104-Prymnesium_polylepis.1
MRDARSMMGITWLCTQRASRQSCVWVEVAALCVVLRGGRACGAPRGARGGGAFVRVMGDPVRGR